MSLHLNLNHLFGCESLSQIGAMGQFCVRNTWLWCPFLSSLAVKFCSSILLVLNSSYVLL